MRDYETLVLLDARRQDAEIEETIKRLSSLLTERGGEIANVERWGRRRLAYEIEGMSEGFYSVLNYTLEPDHLREFEDALPFVEGLVRAKTVRKDVRTRSV